LYIYNLTVHSWQKLLGIYT